jgi:hypothetical protein
VKITLGLVLAIALTCIFSEYETDAASADYNHSEFAKYRSYVLMPPGGVQTMSLSPETAVRAAINSRAVLDLYRYSAVANGCGH